jgi:pimeloyl-ACP methyl ester carboxylesterase
VNLPPLHVVTAGEGAPLLLVHGSAADHTTWAIQLKSMAAHARLITWDRRGADTSPLPAELPYFTVEQHADDAARLIEREVGGPVVACGSSFGGVVVLDLARRRPELVRGAVLLEPPLRPTDEERGIPAGFLADYDRIEREQGGTSAAEFFLRYVLGDEAFERMPRRFQDRSKSMWRQIRQDTAALGEYRVRYPALREVTTPFLLLGGERSAPFFRPTLEALHASLGNARLETLTGAGHMMHAEVFRRFNERLRSFMAEVGHAPQ